VLLLLYLGLSSLAPVRIVLALMESMLYLWCACLIVSLGRQQKRVLHAVALIYLLHFTILLSQGGCFAGSRRADGDGGWLDLIFFMHGADHRLGCCCCLWWPMWRRRGIAGALGADPSPGCLIGAASSGRERGLRLSRRAAWWSWTSITKRVNDQFGHGRGDEVIRYVAGCCGRGTQG
jgi:hypothetical protein